MAHAMYTRNSRLKDCWNKTAASRCGGTGTSRMQEYSLETGWCGRLYGSFAEVRSGTSRKELHCSYRKRYPARDAETMPADNIYSGSSQRQHLCLQWMQLHATEYTGKALWLFENESPEIKVDAEIAEKQWNRLRGCWKYRLNWGYNVLICQCANDLSAWQRSQLAHWHISISAH